MAHPHAGQLDEVLHAVRAGNFAVLAGTLPLLGLGPVTPEVVMALVGVVRDHLHTMCSKPCHVGVDIGFCQSRGPSSRILVRNHTLQGA
jgi:hypothetical protein